MKTDVPKKIYRFLISRQFAVWSLVLLAILLVISGALPDPTQLSQKELAQLEQSRPLLFWMSLHLQTIHLTRSPFFLVFPGIIWLSIALCMIRRLRLELPRLNKTPAVSPSIPEMATIRVAESIESIKEKVKTSLRRQRWRLEDVCENGTIRYFARKGTYGYWGSVVFHLSMLIFLIGIIVSALGRFDAEMVVTEGQSLRFDEHDMLRINRKGMFSPALPGTLITLDRFESEFVRDRYPVDYTAYLKLGDAQGDTQDQKVRVNHPLKVDRWEIFLHRYGFAPRFEIRDKEGRLLFDYFVNLIVSRPEQKDHFDVPHQQLRIETQFFPDYHTEEGKAVSRSPIPKNPVMRVRLFEKGNPVGTQDVALGKTTQIGDYRLTFADLRDWAWFGIVYDPGYGPMIIGFIACVVGLGLRFMNSDKWVHVKLEQQVDSVSVAMSGRSRYFPALFENEINNIMRQLQADAAGARPARGDRS